MTLEQQRAAQAYRHVAAIAEEHPKDSKARKQYASMAQKLPALLRSAGLCQALHFLKSRGKDPERSVLGQLLAHLAEQLRRTDGAIHDGASLCDRVREADLPTYVWMTREALATAEWYARLSQSELEILPGTGD
jgi:CRISPR type III-B/RAMP module-associated protein Cmr5